MKNKLKEIIDKLFKNINKKKLIIAISIIIVIVLATILIINLVANKPKNTTITYDNIAKMVENKDTFLIYYYNSKSSNKNNKEIKKYLDKEKIRYYAYNDVLVDRDEYNNLLKLFDIDKEIFALPAMIYIKNGEMYGNLINVDNTEIVKQFIDVYDLYTVK